MESVERTILPPLAAALAARVAVAAAAASRSAAVAVDLVAAVHLRNHEDAREQQRQPWQLRVPQLCLAAATTDAAIKIGRPTFAATRAAVATTTGAINSAPFYCSTRQFTKLRQLRSKSTKLSNGRGKDKPREIKTTCKCQTRKLCPAFFSLLKQ